MLDLRKKKPATGAKDALARVVAYLDIVNIVTFACGAQLIAPILRPEHNK